MCKVGVVIVTYFSSMSARECIAQLGRSALDHPECEWLIVDNSCSSAERDSLEALVGSNVRVVGAEKNLGFAGGVNRGASLLDSDWLLLINPDVFLSHEGFANLLKIVEDIPSSVSLGAGGLIHEAQIYRGAQLWLGVWFRDRKDRKGTRASSLLGPSGGFGLYRRDAFQEIGGFDESYFAWGEDVEFGLRARRKGYKCIELGVDFNHQGGHSVSNREIAQKRAYSLARNRVRIAREYYSLLHRLWFCLLWLLILPVRCYTNAKRGTIRADITGYIDGWIGQPRCGSQYLW